MLSIFIKLATGKSWNLNPSLSNSVVLNWGRFWPPGAIWSCLVTILIVVGGGAKGI